jgi:hypothetical protein
MPIPKMKIPKIPFGQKKTVAQPGAMPEVAHEPQPMPTPQPTPEQAAQVSKPEAAQLATPEKQKRLAIHKRAWAGIKRNTPRQAWLRRRARLLELRQKAYGEVAGFVDIKKFKITAQNAKDACEILAKDPNSGLLKPQLKKHINKLAGMRVRQLRVAK